MANARSWPPADDPPPHDSRRTAKTTEIAMREATDTTVNANRVPRRNHPPNPNYSLIERTPFSWSPIRHSIGHPCSTKSARQESHCRPTEYANPRVRHHRHHVATESAATPGALARPARHRQERIGRRTRALPCEVT